MTNKLYKYLINSIQSGYTLTKAGIEAVFTGQISSHTHAGGEGSGDVTGPGTNSADYLPQWNGINSKILKNGLAVPAGGLAGLTALAGKTDLTTVKTDTQVASAITNTHASGSDNQDLSGLEPKQAGKSLSKNDLTDILKSTYDGYAGSIAGKQAAMGVDDNYVTDAEKVIIGNASGTNTGDNSVNSNYSGLAASKQDTLVSATNIKTINGVSVLGAGNLPVTGASEYLAKLVLAADKPTGANVTPVTLGLSFNYIANKKYIIDIYALVAPAVATTGCGFMIDVSTAVTYAGTFVSHQLAATGTVSGAGSVGDLAATSSGISSGMVLAAAGGNNFVYGGGIVFTGANAGTATFFFRSETTAVTTCKAGTVIRVMEI